MTVCGNNKSSLQKALTELKIFHTTTPAQYIPSQAHVYIKNKKRANEQEKSFLLLKTIEIFKCRNVI